MEGGTVRLPGAPLQPEEGDALIHGLGLLFERLGGRRILLDQRRVLLRNLVHLRQRLVDLLDPARLFDARIGDIGHHRGDLLDRFHDLVERGAGLVDELDTVLDLRWSCW